jgi:hypothetical protein
MTDTSDHVKEFIRLRLMALSGAERLIMGVQSFEAARRMMIASFPSGLTDSEFRRLLYERTYGEPMPEGMEAAAEERKRRR